MLTFTGERIVPGASNCEPLFARKMYMEHSTRYRFAAQLVRGKRVLDIGCGVGYGSQLLAACGAAEVLAFDVAADAIEHARRHYTAPNIRFEVASAEDFSFDGIFDLVTCFELIEHVDAPTRVLESIRKHLKQDGILFISSPRHLGKNRSAFHTKEYYWHEFRALLSSYFPHLKVFVENNHLASLVAENRPQAVDQIYCLTDVFHPDTADYFIVVAGNSPIPELRPILSLDDESYLKLQERDVRVLHAAEDQLKIELEESRKKIANLEERIRQQQELEAETQAILNSHKSELKSVQQQASDRLTTIGQLGSELELLRESQGNLSTTLASQAKALDEQLRIQEELGKNFSTLSADRAREIEQLQQRLIAQAEQFRVELTHHSRNAEELSSEIERLRSELAEASREIEGLTLHLNKQVGDTQRAAREAERYKEETVRHTSLTDKLSNELTTLREQLAAKQQELQLLETRAESYRTEAERHSGRVERMTRSLSWQITWPLRATPKFLRRLMNGSNHLVVAPPPLPPESTTTLLPHPANHVPPRPDLVPRLPTDFATRREPIELDILYIVGCLEGESKRYRVFNLIEGLQALGHTAGALYEIDCNRIIQLGLRCRLIVFFRAAYSRHVQDLIDFARVQAIGTVFDVDDLIFEPDSIDYVRAIKHFNAEQRAAYRADVQRYRRTLELCDYATATTNPLVKRIANLGKQVQLIPNGLNSAQLRLADACHRDTLGLPGILRIAYLSGSSTHQVDFAACENALLRILETNPTARFVLVGHLDLPSKWDHLADRVERHEFMSYSDLMRLQATISINLAPLEISNPYCEGKSQLKIFEAGVLGIPTVASAVASYSDAITDGQDGFLCRTEEDWFGALNKLCRDTELRRNIGDRARVRALNQYSPEAVSRIAWSAYSTLLSSPRAPSRRVAVSERRPLRITWLVPGLIIGGGGHRNILRAAYFLKQFGHDLELYFTGVTHSDEHLRELVRTHFYPLECPMHAYTGTINETDVLFATHWSTVDAALRARHCAGHLCYFVQDFEPAFAAMGSEYVLAENTYRKGLYHICSGPWCEHVLRQRFHAKADHFVFPIDTTVYFPRPRTRSQPTLLFFAKPEMPRRCYELGIFALSKVAAEIPEVEIVFFGSSNVKPEDVPFPVHIAGVLPTIGDLADLYANADAGIVFSTTNPSLVPYEMMACGLPVIDLSREGNELNYGSRFNIARLVDPEPDAMAKQIIDLLLSPLERQERSRAGLEFVRAFPTEEGMAKRVEELIYKQINAN